MDITLSASIADYLSAFPNGLTRKNLAKKFNIKPKVMRYILKTGAQFQSHNRTPYSIKKRPVWVLNK
jgi:hypothetical protein